MRRADLLALMALFSVALGAERAFAQVSAACTVTSTNVSENFTSNIDANNTTPGDANGPTKLTLGTRAGGFSGASSVGTMKFLGTGTRRLVAVVAGDFDQTGDDDLIVINATPSCEVDFVNIVGGLVTNEVTLASCASRTNAALAAGDVNADGKLDFVMATTVGISGGTVSGAINTVTLFVNKGNTSGVPQFTQIDISAGLKADNVNWFVGGSQIVLQDYNGDGRADLFVLSGVGSTSKVLLYPSSTAANIFSGQGQVLLTNAGLFTPIATTSSPSTVGYGCTPSLSPSIGGTVLAVADFNRDGRLDLITSSASEAAMHYFLQNADHSFTQVNDIPLSAGGAFMGFGRDIDQDGSPDLVFFRSGKNCGGTPGEVWVLYNDGRGNMNLSATRLQYGHSITFAAVLNFDGDARGTPDLFAGRHSASGSFAVYLNTASSSVYNLQAVATSKKLNTSDPNVAAVISATLTSFPNAVPTGTTLKAQLSNDGGLNWETLNAAELAGSEHSFSHFGGDLRWRVLMTGAPATLTGSNAVFAPGSLSTPSVSPFTLNVNTVPKLVYSRSALASGTFSSPTLFDMLYSADFLFPSYYGQLYAYNLASLNPNSASTGSLQTVNTGANPPVWEAGSQLASRSGTSRTLYLANANPPPTAAVDPLTLPTLNGRLTGTDANLAQVGATANSVASILGVANVPATNAPGLLAFLAGGMGDVNGYKLRDPGHASPVFVGPPNGDPNYMGTGYAAFVANNAGRAPTVYLGANDGMLHAFDGRSGNELWGLVPFNLISAFTAQASQNGNIFTYAHQNGVDATPTVADVYSGGSWHTVAVGGQGLGQGIGGNGYVYAVDITSPTSPQPLWEYSDIWGSFAASCQLNNNQVTTCNPTCVNSTAPGACHDENNVYDSFFNTTATTPGYMAFQDLDDGDCVGDFASSFSCSYVQFSFKVNTAGTYYPHFLVYYNNYAPANQVGIIWSLDGIQQQTIQVATSASRFYSQYWQAGQGAPMAVGEHTIEMTSTTNTPVYFTGLGVSPTTSPPASTNDTGITVCEQSCTPACSTQTYTSPSSTPWPQCGLGTNQQCCGDPNGDQFCAATGSVCATPASNMGQTFSTPAIGQLQTSTGGLWAAFFASGYNARQSPNTGRAVYAVNAYTGAPIAQWNFNDLPLSSLNPSTIDNTLPGSVSLVDVDNDGYVDRAYVGDLEGRLWKLNVSKAIGGSSASPGDYPSCLLFDAGDPNQTGGMRTWAPISLKPAVAVLQAGQPNIYFGTGGDDRAPDNIMYKFYSLRDTDAAGACMSTPKKENQLTAANGEWVVGDGLSNTNPPVALSGPTALNEGAPGDRFWADPVIVNNTTVYFTALPGKIESVNQCNTSGAPASSLASKVYAYAITDFTDASGGFHPTGQSILDNNSPWLQAYGKVRKSAMLRGAAASLGVVHGTADANYTGKGDIFIQSSIGDGTNPGAVIQRLGTPGSSPSKSKLRILRWREVPL